MARAVQQNAIQARMAKLEIRPGKLAESLGLTRQRVHQLVTGKDTAFHQATIDKLCRALACNEDELFEERRFMVKRKVIRKAN